MNNQGWPDERCAACGLKAKLNMGARGNAPLYIRLRPCARCKEVRYCNRDCQRKDWAKHKKNCVLPGDQPPPPMDEDLRKAVMAQIARRGVYIMAHASDKNGTGKLGPDDKIHVHTIGFHEHGAPELFITNLPHRLLQRAGGFLSYTRNERPVDKPFADGETMAVNGLTFKAESLTGTSLQTANDRACVAVRAFYELKKSAPLVPFVSLTLEKEDELDPEILAKLEAKPADYENDPVRKAEALAAERLAAQVAAQDAFAANRDRLAAKAAGNPVEKRGKPVEDGDITGGARLALAEMGIA